MSTTESAARDAIGGYDAVAYFEQGSAVTGRPEHSVEHNGLTWRFATAEHARAFEAAPDRYRPAYEGRCAFAMSLGKQETGDPRQWQVRGGRLYLNSNPVAHLLWKVLPGRARAADRHWQGGR